MQDRRGNEAHLLLLAFERFRGIFVVVIQVDLHRIAPLTTTASAGRRCLHYLGQLLLVQPNPEIV